MPRLSLIVATYNRAEQLLTTLRSVAAQTAPAAEWECVVVDNNSTDDTAARFEEFRTAHPELPLRRVSETRQGLSWARNRGIAETTGDIVAIIDDGATVKRFFREADHIRLQPENSTMDPIITTDCSIAGKVVAVFRRL